MLCTTHAKETPMSTPSTSSESRKPAEAASSAGTLQHALDQNESAKVKVEQSASELVVINAVLKQEVPHQALPGEVAEALKKTDKLEVKLTQAVQELEEVNQTLAEQIDQREDLERELAEVKAKQG